MAFFLKNPESLFELWGYYRNKDVFYCEKLGLPPLQIDYDHNDPAIRAIWKKYKNAGQVLIDKEPCEVAFCFPGGIQSFFVCTKESCYTSQLAIPESTAPLTEEQEEIDMNRHWQLRQFCQIMEIPFQRPEWHVAKIEWD